MPPKRTKTGQKRHDTAVNKTASYYEGLDYNVKADVPGRKKPPSIGGFVPDVIAKKGKIEKIIEVETRDTMKKDKEQHKAFKNYADRKKSRSFRRKLA